MMAIAKENKWASFIYFMFPNGWAVQFKRAERKGGWDVTAKSEDRFVEFPDKDFRTPCQALARRYVLRAERGKR